MNREKPKVWTSTVFVVCLICVTVLVGNSSTNADELLLKTHCAKCHSGKTPKGDFDIQHLQKVLTQESIDFWIDSLDRVKSEEMPPAKQNKLSKVEREKLVQFMRTKIDAFESGQNKIHRTPPRRLNNRELTQSIADALLIENVGTHEPMANLLGDTLHDGFDTNGDSLGISEFHLEQYVNAFRKVIDTTIFTGPRPDTQSIRIRTRDLRITDTSNRRRVEQANRTAESIEILDLRKQVYFDNFQVVPYSGRYKIKIRAMGVDRNVYDSKFTGHHADDPIRLRVHLGDVKKDFDLNDGKVTELLIDQWLSKGTRIQISYLTDALRLNGNGNFKFQYRIARDYIKENNPELYDHVVKNEVPKSRFRKDRPDHWVHWQKYWQGPRPRIFNAEIEGPLYESWPPKRHVALLGKQPSAGNAESILQPIANRAWRRNVSSQELAPFVNLVQSRSKTIGDLNALKEGIVALLASPSFLLINSEKTTPNERFATKLSFFLRSRLPSNQLRKLAGDGQLDSFESVLQQLKKDLASAKADPFKTEFPHAWLQLDRINFMAPDPDKYPIYSRKSLSDDMIGEVNHFFEDAVNNNVAIPQLLTANYSFVNADLATVYGIQNIAPDSKFRKHVFQDGRRGGLLGMGAFLTLTADSLGTSPIHRAVYVMENFLGIKPTPPPGDVEIAEPDVRQAKTIKEILNAHRADTRCASCHQSIDPYGYAFENFDPVGSWRDEYTAHLSESRGARRNAKSAPISVDASSTFRNGKNYQDIREFRQLMKSEANQERFVRCFIKKLLVYANGEEPENFSEVEKILAVSKTHDYRIVETIAAVIHSPLFRDQ